MKENNHKAWNESTINYQQSKFVSVEQGCFAYMATNVGDTIVDVNGNRLFPSATPATVVGDSISKSAPAGQVYKGQMKITFILPLGAAPNVEITQLFYLEDQAQK